MKATNNNSTRVSPEADSPEANSADSPVANSVDPQPSPVFDVALNLPRRSSSSEHLELSRDHPNPFSDMNDSSIQQDGLHHVQPFNLSNHSSSANVEVFSVEGVHDPFFANILEAHAELTWIPAFDQHEVAGMEQSDITFSTSCAMPFDIHELLEGDIDLLYHSMESVQRNQMLSDTVELNRTFLNAGDGASNRVQGYGQQFSQALELNGNHQSSESPVSQEQQPSTHAPLITYNYCPGCTRSILDLDWTLHQETCRQGNDNAN